MNLANFISLARLLSVPVFVWLVITDQTKAAFFLFIAAALSDAVDGFIAKHFDMRTKLGAYLDPIADKTLLVTAYVVLGSNGMLPVWIVIPVVSRDALIVGGAMVFERLTGDLDVEPILISKINTAMQSLLVGAALLPSVFASPMAPVVTLLSFAVLVTTLVSGGAYVFIWTMRARAIEDETGENAKRNAREP